MLLAAPGNGCRPFSPRIARLPRVDCAYASAALRRSLHALGMPDWEDDPAAAAWLDAPLEEQGKKQRRRRQSMAAR